MISLPYADAWRIGQLFGSALLWVERWVRRRYLAVWECLAGRRVGQAMTMTDKALNKFASILGEADTSPIVADPHDDQWIWQGDGSEDLDSMGVYMRVSIMAGQLRSLVAPRGWTRSRIRSLVWAMLEARANTQGWVMPTPIARADQALRDALDGLRDAIATGECEPLGVAAVDHPADPTESVEAARSVLARLADREAS